jgi:hypothetical protein
MITRLLKRHDTASTKSEKRPESDWGAVGMSICRPELLHAISAEGGALPRIVQPSAVARETTFDTVTGASGWELACCLQQCAPHGP